jgi:hypothetical protein
VIDLRSNAGYVALTNAQKQARWRNKRNDLAKDLVGRPTDIADNILHRLGPDATRKVAQALSTRLRNLRPDCPQRNGTGFAPFHSRTACGMLIGVGKYPCDCGPDPQQSFVRGMMRSANRNNAHARRKAARKQPTPAA